MKKIIILLFIFTGFCHVFAVEDYFGTSSDLINISILVKTEIFLSDGGLVELQNRTANLSAPVKDFVYQQFRKKTINYTMLNLILPGVGDFRSGNPAMGKVNSIGAVAGWAVVATALLLGDSHELYQGLLLSGGISLGAVYTSSIVSPIVYCRKWNKRLSRGVYQPSIDDTLPLENAYYDPGDLVYLNLFRVRF